MSFLRSALLVLLFTVLVTGQSYLSFSDLWQAESDASISGRSDVAVEKTRLFRLDVDKLSNFLSDAPSLDYVTARGGSLLGVDKIVPLPTPDARTETFRVVSVPTLKPELSEKTGIKTFQLLGHSNRYLRGSLTIGPHLGADMEVHRLAAENSEPFQITTVSFNEREGPSSTYQVFWSHSNQGHGSCAGHKTPEEIAARDEKAQEQIFQEEVNHEHGKRTATLGSNRITYRIAIAATKEFTNAYSGNQVTAFNRVVAITNEVNTIYNAEFNVQFTIISDSSIMYTNANPSIWLNNCGDDVDLAKDSFSSATGISASSYDLAHVYGQGGLGVAYIGALCNAGYKSGGCSGNSPSSSDFSRMVAHEIGHMFGSYHTHSTNAGQCANSATAGHTREPGAGSTIMAYGVICPDYYQNYFDLYFHSHSLLAGQSTMTGAPSCGTTGASNNLPAITIDVPTARTIPIGTPFRLSASATDADGDSLTYSWEQYNVGEEAPQSQLDDGVVQLFRSYPGTTDGYRIFPQDPEVRDFVNTGEQLPAVSRASMPFNLIVRDGKGWTIDQSVDLVVDGSKGPFSLTTTDVTTGTNAAISWSVANTNSLSANVNFKLFDAATGEIVSVKLNSANSGSGNLCIPFSLNSTTVYKLRVEAVTGIWFDQKTLTITEGTSAGCTPTLCDAGTEIIDVKVCAVQGNTSGGVSSTTQTTSSSGSSPASRQLPPSWASSVYENLVLN